MGMRLAAALLIAVQLTQLAAPALCERPGQAVPCHETTPAGLPQMTASLPAHDMACAQSAMCVVPSVVLPEASIVLTAPAVALVAAPAARTLRPGDGPAPLSPPPQA